MRISKREKMMLLILGILVIGIGYYQFGYLTLTQKVQEKTAKRNEIEDKYNKAMLTINSLENQKSKVKILNAKIDNESAPLYPTISQEHIILEMDKLIKESGLEGGMTFEAKDVKAVESLKKSEKDKDLPQSSLQKEADAYKSKYGESEDDKNTSSDNGDNSSSSNQNASDSDNSNTAKAKESNDTNKENTVTQIKMNVDFNGSYEDVVKFLKAIGDYERKIPVYTINMSQKNLDEVKGSVNMVLYSVPKINDEISEYLKWNLNNTYGKSKPFNVDSGVGNGIKSEKDTNDFMVSVK